MQISLLSYKIYSITGIKFSKDYFLYSYIYRLYIIELTQVLFDKILYKDLTKQNMMLCIVLVNIQTSLIFCQLTQSTLAI